MNNEPQLRTLGDYSYDSKYCVGEGAFGKVYRGVKRSTNQEVAIKKLDASMINKDPYLRDSLEAEIQILRRLHHPNIVQFIDKFSTDRSIYIVTEFCADGDLRTLMKGQQIDESQILEIFCQLTSGFKELVKESIIHRDLKPANILNHKGIVKIADFGFAKFVDNFSQQLLRTCVGSPLYMSPQILKRLPYTTKSDIWSLGVIYYEMLFNKPPWNGFDEKSLVNSIMNKPLDIPKNKKLSSLSLNFIQGALVKEEGGRMDWTQVFELFDSLKKQQKVSDTVYFKDARPSVIQQYQGEDVLKSLQNLNQIRQQLGLNHFVNVELIQNIYLINSFYHKELQFEIFSLLSTKLTLLQYQVLYQKCRQLLEKNKISEYQKYLNVVKGELDVANEFLQDTLQYFERMGLLQNIKSQLDYQYISKDVECCEQLENIVKNKSQGIVKHILNENGVELPYELLILLDYMLDVRIVYNRIVKNQQVDFSLVHDKTRYKSKLSVYIHDLGFKLNEAFNY